MKKDIKYTGAGIIFISQNKNTLLLQKPTLKWGFPGGHKNKNEQPSITATRETLEEIGVNINPLYCNLYIKTLLPNKEICFSFIIKIKNEFSPKLSFEHINYKWININKLLSVDLTKSTKLIYKRFLQKTL